MGFRTVTAVNEAILLMSVGWLIIDQRQFHRKHTPFWVVVLDPYLTPIAVDQCLDEMQTEASARAVEALFPLFEDPAFLFVRDPRPVVSDPDTCDAASLGR